MATKHYTVKSLELHLFFGRIMKEHALFLRAGFTPANPDFMEKAEHFIEEFENLLRGAIELADGVVTDGVLRSGEIVTEYTLLAEKQTERLTALPIDQEITCCAINLKPGTGKKWQESSLQRKVRQLNRTALKLLDGLIELKENILGCVASGNLFIPSYPLLIEHILREAKLYRRYVHTLETIGKLPVESMQETECFWNQIMMEHAQFIRGLLDPCEDQLIDTAHSFARGYCALLEVSRTTYDKAISLQSLKKTENFRDFKAAGTDGIQNSQIRSMILPLLADHVLREANHYIRLLK